MELCKYLKNKIRWSKLKTRFGISFKKHTENNKFRFNEEGKVNRYNYIRLFLIEMFTCTFNLTHNI